MKIIDPLTFNGTAFTRATEASYFNNEGILKFAGPNVLRVGYNPRNVTPIGPIYESAQTNLLDRTNGFDLVSWVKDGPTYATITPNDPRSASPEGLPNAFGMSQGAIYQTITPTTGVAFSLHVKLRQYPPPFPQTNYDAKIAIELRYSQAPVAKTASANFSFYNNSDPTISIFNSSSPQWSPPQAIAQKLQDGWWRITIYWNTVIDTVRISHAGSDIKFIYGAQAEQIVGAFTGPSSYIRDDDGQGGIKVAVRGADLFVGEGEPPLILSTNVLYNDAPEWSPGETYPIGARVIVLGADPRVYEAIRENIGQNPLQTLGEDWLDVGPINAFRMFDMTTGAENQTVANNGNSLQVSVRVDGRVNGVVLLNVEGYQAVIRVRDAQGNVLHQMQKYIRGAPLTVGWYDWFFGERGDNSLIIYEGFSIPEGQEGIIDVIIDGGDTPAKIGKLIVGDVIEIGCVRFGSSGGIIDFSQKDRDIFGNSRVIRRRYVDRFDYDIQLNTDTLYDVKVQLAELRGKPAVYMGSENHLITVVFGFPREFNIVIAGPKKSSCALQIEGI